MRVVVPLGVACSAAGLETSRTAAKERERRVAESIVVKDTPGHQTVASDAGRRLSEACKRPAAARCDAGVSPVSSLPMMIAPACTGGAALTLPAFGPDPLLAPATLSNIASTALMTLPAAQRPALRPGRPQLPLTAVGAAGCTALDVHRPRSELHEPPQWRERRPTPTYGALARAIFERLQAALERHFRWRVRGPYEDVLLTPARVHRPAIQRLADALAVVWAHPDWEAIDAVQISTQQVLCRATDFFPELDIQPLRVAVTARLNHVFDGRRYDHVVINPDNGHVTAYAGGAFNSLLTGQDASAWSSGDMGMWSFAERIGTPTSRPARAMEALSAFPLLLALHAGRFPPHVAVD